LDLRDSLLDEISEVIPVTISTNNNLTVNLHLGNKSILKAGEQKLFFEAVQTDDVDNPVRIQLKDKDDVVRVQDISDSLTTGGLKGILDAGGSGELSYKAVLDEIDRIAFAFATEMNNIQTGLGTDGVAGSIPYCVQNGVLVQAAEPIFVSEGGGAFTAESIKINEKLLADPGLIATARGDNTLAGTAAVGNAQNMALFNKLSSLEIPSLSNGGTGQTLENFILTLVSSIGSKIESVNSATTAQSSVVTQAQSKRAEKVGVNLNEELSDLIKYQRAYEASARVFSVASELMQTLVNLAK
jgi:flagellar hook-associated protein 1 FlgK